MLKVIFITLIVAGLIASTLSLGGCQHFRKPEKRAEWVKDKIIDELELNKAQQDLLDDIWAEFAKQREKLKPGHEAAKKEMVEALRRPELDTQAINRKIEEKMETFKAISARFVERMAEFHRTLNEEQREKLIAVLEKHHGNKRRCSWGR
jgi:periplasmic protein CpxP/Spy